MWRKKAPMPEPIQFVVNERGEKIASIISIEEYERILKSSTTFEAYVHRKKNLRNH
jgi:hypothetical protein